MLEERVLENIKKYNLIKPQENIVIGVSGGPDSIALLDILKKISNTMNFKINVAHINHMIRTDAIDDEKYVEEYCKTNNIPFFVERKNVEEIAKNKKIGTEEAGRELRYSFFEDILIKTNSTKIATAHTANDNAETVLLNIIRGTGPSGLKGIEIIRDNKFIRPLINIKKVDIEEYCAKNNLNPRYDSTNFENIYSRNKVRNVLIPYIEKEFNPSIIESINRLSDIAKSENEYFEKEVKRIYQNIVVEEGKKQIILDLKKYNQLENVIKNRIMLYTINKLFGVTSGIEKKHLEDINKLCSNNIGNKFLVPNKKVKILVKNKKIFILNNIQVP